MSSNIFTLTFSRFKLHQTFYEIAQDCKKEVNLTILKSIDLRVFEILQKYDALNKKYVDRQAQIFKRQIPGQSLSVEVRIEKIISLLISGILSSLLQKAFLNQLNLMELNVQGVQQQKHFTPQILGKSDRKELLKGYLGRERIITSPQIHIVKIELIRNKMLGKWAEISRLIFFQSEGQYFKTSKQCRQHWFNHLNKSIKHGAWEIEEDIVILYSALDYGHKWARVVEALEKTRTQHMIKNRFYSLLTNSTKCNSQKRIEDKDEGKIIRRLINELNEKKARLKESQQKSNTVSNEMNEIGEKAEHFPQNQVYLKVQNSQEDKLQGAEKHLVEKESTEKKQLIEKEQDQLNKIDVKIEAEGMNSEKIFNHQSHADNWAFNKNFYSNPFMASSLLFHPFYPHFPPFYPPS